MVLRLGEVWEGAFQTPKACRSSLKQVARGTHSLFVGLQCEGCGQYMVELRDPYHVANLTVALNRLAIDVWPDFQQVKFSAEIEHLKLVPTRFTE